MPILDSVNMAETYKRAAHWINSFIATFVVYNISLYFTKINPRKFYFCMNVIITTIALTVSSIALIIALGFISTVDGVSTKVIWITVAAAIYLLIIYAFVCRGIAVYQKGKIRIFKVRIKSYSTDKIDDVQFEYTGKKCRITIVINGEENTFKLPSGSAKLSEKRFRALVRKK